MITSGQILEKIEAVKARIDSYMNRRESLLEDAAAAEIASKPAADGKALRRINDDIADQRDLLQRLEAKHAIALEEEVKTARASKLAHLREVDTLALASWAKSLDAARTGYAAIRSAITAMVEQRSAVREAIRAYDPRQPDHFDLICGTSALTELHRLLENTDNALNAGLRAVAREYSDVGSADNHLLSVQQFEGSGPQASPVCTIAG